MAKRNRPSKPLISKSSVPKVGFDPSAMVKQTPDGEVVHEGIVNFQAYLRYQAEQSDEYKAIQPAISSKLTPVLYTQEIMEHIIMRVSWGETLKNISLSSKMPSYFTLKRWCMQDFVFRDQISQARLYANEHTFPDYIIDTIDCLASNKISDKAALIILKAINDITNKTNAVRAIQNQPTTTMKDHDQYQQPEQQYDLQDEINQCMQHTQQVDDETYHDFQDVVDD